MEIRAIRPPVAAVLDAATSATRSRAPSDAGGDFASLIAKSLERVNASQAQAESTAQQYQLGQNDVSLEDAMIAMQKANIGLSATVQVRNKLVAAYNDIMNMPI